MGGGIARKNRKQTRSRTVQVQGGRASEGGTRDGWCGWKIKSEGATKEGERTSRLEKDVWEKRVTRFSWGKGNELGDTGWLLVLGAWGDSRLKMILADPLACQSWPHPGAVGVSGPSGASRLWAAVKIEASSGSLFSLAEPQRHTHVGFFLTKPGVVVQSVTVLWGRCCRGKQATASVVTVAAAQQRTTTRAERWNMWDPQPGAKQTSHAN